MILCENLIKSSVFLLNDLKAETPHFVDFRFILNESIAGKKAQESLKKKLNDVNIVLNFAWSRLNNQSNVKLTNFLLEKSN